MLKQIARKRSASTPGVRFLFSFAQQPGQGEIQDRKCLSLIINGQQGNPADMARLQRPLVLTYLGWRIWFEMQRWAWRLDNSAMHGLTGGLRQKLAVARIEHTSLSVPRFDSMPANLRSIVVRLSIPQAIVPLFSCHARRIGHFGHASTTLSAVDLLWI